MSEQHKRAIKELRAEVLQLKETIGKQENKIKDLESGTYKLTTSLQEQSRKTEAMKA